MPGFLLMFLITDLLTFVERLFEDQRRVSHVSHFLNLQAGQIVVKRDSRRTSTASAHSHLFVDIYPNFDDDKLDDIVT
jgi:hypothetical protein